MANVPETAEESHHQQPHDSQDGIPVDSVSTTVDEKPRTNATSSLPKQTSCQTDSTTTTPPSTFDYQAFLFFLHQCLIPGDDIVSDARKAKTSNMNAREFGDAGRLQGSSSSDSSVYNYWRSPWRNPDQTILSNQGCQCCLFETFLYQNKKSLELSMELGLIFATKGTNKVSFSKLVSPLNASNIYGHFKDTLKMDLDAQLLHSTKEAAMMDWSRLLASALQAMDLDKIQSPKSISLHYSDLDNTCMFEIPTTGATETIPRSTFDTLAIAMTQLDRLDKQPSQKAHDEDWEEYVQSLWKQRQVALANAAREQNSPSEDMITGKTEKTVQEPSATTGPAPKRQRRMPKARRRVLGKSRK